MLSLRGPAALAFIAMELAQVRDVPAIAPGDEHAHLETPSLGADTIVQPAMARNMIGEPVAFLPDADPSPPTGKLEMVVAGSIQAR